jgi:pimeloyl-ACP methyl ester carboxylesterase
MLALLDALGIVRVGVIGHDVGGAAMQPLARTAPERLNEVWYQSFNQMGMASSLVRATRDRCRTFISHFLRHWSHRKEEFDDR